MALRCLFGFHKWQKQGGPMNRGNGQFEQRLICIKCGKIRYYKS